MTKRLYSLKLDELSLVDAPAIVEEFIVTKRNETVAPAADPVVPVAKNDAAGAETAPIVTEKVDGEAAPAAGGVAMPLHQALIDEKIVAIKAGLEKLIADASSGSADYEDLRDRMWDIQDLMWGVLRDSAALTIAKSADGATQIGKALETIQKARESMHPAAIADLIEVAKAAACADGKTPGMKKFTKARVEKLAKALGSLHEVLAEVSPSDVEKALSTDIAEEAAAAPDATPATDPTAEEVAKNNAASVDALRVQLQKAQEAVTAANEAAAAAATTAAEVQKRVEALEAVGVGKGLATDPPPADQVPVKKSKWTGVV